MVVDITDEQIGHQALVEVAVFASQLPRAIWILEAIS